jgi:hypothetical protein
LRHAQAEAHALSLSVVRAVDRIHCPLVIRIVRETFLEAFGVDRRTVSEFRFRSGGMIRSTARTLVTRATGSRV